MLPDVAGLCASVFKRVVFPQPLQMGQNMLIIHFSFEMVPGTCDVISKHIRFEVGTVLFLETAYP